MSRFENLQALRSHPMIGRDFKRLGPKLLAEVEAFVRENEHLTDDEYLLKANRFKLDQPRDKKYPLQWSLITQSVRSYR